MYLYRCTLPTFGTMHPPCYDIRAPNQRTARARASAEVDKVSPRWNTPLSHWHVVRLCSINTNPDALF